MENIQYIDRATGLLMKETVPGEGWLKWLYHNRAGKLMLSAVVKRKFLSAFYGSRMDRPASAAKIKDFVKSLDIDMSEAVRGIDDFKTFNEFFIRKLKPESRPVHNDEDVIVSPADGKIMAFYGIDELDRFFAKGQEFCLSSFLRDKALSDKYLGGTLLIIRLAPADYHRFHFPADGRVGPSRLNNGDYYSVSPYAVKDRLSIYWENKRAYCVLETDNAGDVLICEVGATMVGSIVQTYTADSEVKKGQEKGYFKFGGSTVIMLLEKGKARIDDDIVENTRSGNETAIKMGEGIARVLK